MWTPLILATQHSHISISSLLMYVLKRSELKARNISSRNLYTIFVALLSPPTISLSPAQYFTDKNDWSAFAEQIVHTVYTYLQKTFATDHLSVLFGRELAELPTQEYSFANHITGSFTARHLFPYLLTGWMGWFLRNQQNAIRNRLICSTLKQSFLFKIYCFFRRPSAMHNCASSFSNLPSSGTSRSFVSLHVLHYYKSSINSFFPFWSNYLFSVSIPFSSSSTSPY